MRLLKRNMPVTCDIHASTAMVSAMVSCANKPEVTTINDKSGHCRLSRHFYCIRAIFIWPWKMNLVSVRYLFYQPMDEKIKTWTLRFPAKENTNMEKALFDWPIVLHMTSKLSIDWFLESSRAWSFSPERSLNQPKDMRVCIRSINQSNHSIPVRCCLCFVARFQFKVIRKSLY